MLSGYRLVNLARPDGALLLGSIALLACSSSITLALPAITGHVLDTALDPKAHVATDMLYGGLTALFILQAGMMFGRLAMQVTAGENLTARLE